MNPFLDNHEEGWRCPGCQNSSTVVPSVYKCFCGRVLNPGEKRGRGDMTVPHSCGELCLRKLAASDNDSCTHKCHQLCHPGPCPPCPVTVLKRCPCGKSRYISLDSAWLNCSIVYSSILFACLCGYYRESGGWGEANPLIKCCIERFCIC